MRGCSPQGCHAVAQRSHRPRGRPLPDRRIGLWYRCSQRPAGPVWPVYEVCRGCPIGSRFPYK
jgi:hypothetical protein